MRLTLLFKLSRVSLSIMQIDTYFVLIKFPLLILLQIYAVLNKNLLCKLSLFSFPLNYKTLIGNLKKKYFLIYNITDNNC